MSIFKFKSVRAEMLVRVMVSMLTYFMTLVVLVGMLGM